MLGNGNILVGFDHFGQVSDFYYPYVGMENQIDMPSPHKIGVWIDEKMHWLDDGTWTIRVHCKKETFSSTIYASHKELRIEIEFNDVVYNEKNVLVRKIIVSNKRDTKTSIKLFFHCAFKLYGSERGDTAFFDPHDNVIIHYEGRRVFLINARIEGRGFDDYSTGIYGIEEKEGTFKDAEDGVLSKNPIEHGTVDSVIGISVKLEPNQNKTIYYWITVGSSHEEVHSLNHYVLKKTPEHLMKTTQDFWHAWINKRNFKFHGLSEDVVKLFKKSLFYIRAHSDNRGAIIASGDSDMLQHGRDTYSYMWPRDGSISAMALDRAGDSHVAERFFSFCKDILTKEGYFLHKYRSDKSWGSSWHPWVRDGVSTLPIQEDETALVLYALYDHYFLSKDLEFIENLYNPLIKKAGDFLARYRDDITGLPNPSYDLWEEKFGVSTFTSSTVYGALIAAHKFAKLLGKDAEASYYKESALSVQKAILTHLYDEKGEMFYKLIYFKNGEKITDATLDMSSIYGIFKFKVLPVDDTRVVDSINTIKNKMCCKTPIGGVPRYTGDRYYHVSNKISGNPWFITTLWLAQYYIEIAKKEEDFDDVKKWLEWTVRYSLPSGVLSEQLNPFTGEQYSAAPLTWSHSEFVITVLRYLERLGELGICNTCYPLKRYEK